ncbi:MAG TPA: CYTH and CHAD domain-containing protein [Dermatophilaceae bacterium]
MDRYSEVERKFDADPAMSLPDVTGEAGSVGEATESQLDATYFDTADARLARHHVTLRRRTGGDDAGWHLKLPAGQDERTEVRLPLGRATRTVPAALVREVRAIAGDRPLVPIATLHTTRIERRLLDADGNALAAIADDTVHGQRLTGAAAEESTWREVEVELLDGDRALLDDVSGRLRAAGLTPSRSSSKLARVLGDVAAQPPAVGDAMSKARRATAGAVVLAYLQEHVDRLVSCDRGVRSDQPGAVHDMRVATRRLRSTLATYQPLLDREQTDPIRAELKWLGEALGRPRDAEVLHQRMLDLVAAQPEEPDLGPVSSRIDSELAGRHRLALVDLQQALDGDRYFRLLNALDDLLARPPLTATAGKPARKQLPALVGHVARRVDRAARAVADDWTPQARNQGLHEVRKCAKRARYAAESAIPVAGKPARRMATRMESLQNVLGEHQDSVTAQALLLELTMTDHLSEENGFAFGLLYAQERARANHARRAYIPALRKASAGKTRRWTQ